jgi:hypothetical protein
MVCKIAIFDYKVIFNSIGGCHLRMLRGLCHEHEFTVFAVEFENPCPERIRWVRILAGLVHLPFPLGGDQALTIGALKISNGAILYRGALGCEAA